MASTLYTHQPITCVTQTRLVKVSSTEKCNILEGHSQGKSALKQNSRANKKYEYGHPGGCFIKSNLYKCSQKVFSVLKLK